MEVLVLLLAFQAGLQSGGTRKKKSIGKCVWTMTPRQYQNLYDVGVDPCEYVKKQLSRKDQKC
jgi:hypothetical protein